VALVSMSKQEFGRLEQVKAQQAAYSARQQRGHVARQRPPNNLEAPGLPSKGRVPRVAAAAAATRSSRTERVYEPSELALARQQVRFQAPQHRTSVRRCATPEASRPPAARTRPQRGVISTLRAR
jgi:hypothetical protein